MIACKLGSAVGENKTRCCKKIHNTKRRNGASWPSLYFHSNLWLDLPSAAPAFPSAHAWPSSFVSVAPVHTWIIHSKSNTWNMWMSFSKRNSTIGLPGVAFLAPCVSFLRRRVVAAIQHEKSLSTILKRRSNEEITCRRRRQVYFSMLGWQSSSSSLLSWILSHFE